TMEKTPPARPKPPPLSPRSPAFAARDCAEAVVDSIPHPLVVLTKALTVQSANQAFYDTFDASKGETEGRLIYNLGAGQWNMPGLRKALESVGPNRGSFQDFAVSFPACANRRKLPGQRRTLPTLF